MIDRLFSSGFKSLHRDLRRGVAIGLVMNCFPVMVHAQQVSATDEANDVAGGDIVVTAQRDTSLASKTPIALTAIEGDSLLQSGVTNPIGLANEVPGITINRFYGVQIAIRGITNTDTTAKGDPSAAFLLDGIYIARPQAQEVSFLDIDRVEVLRGPQGTLYGRNSTAGVINLITKRPTDKFEVNGNFGYGNYEAVQADLVVNIPVVDGFAVRVAGSLDRRDSYFIKAADDPYDQNPFKDNKTLRVSAEAVLTDNLNLFVVGDYSSIQGINQITVDGRNFFSVVNGQAIYNADASADDRLSRGFSQVGEPYGDDYTYGLMGELSWNLGPIAITYIGSYRRFKIREGVTELLGMVKIAHSNQIYQQNAHELRFALNNVDRFKLQAGANYFYEWSSVYIFQPNYYAYDEYTQITDPTKATSYAVFGQGTYDVTDAFRLTAGLRYTSDSKSQRGEARSLIYGEPENVYVTGADVDFSKVTWRISADLDLGPRNMLYASVATGYKAGGFNSGCLEGAVFNGRTCTHPLSAELLYYAPETLTAYEVGLKGRTVDNSVRYDLTAYYYDYTNMQMNGTFFYNGVSELLVGNAGKSRVFGVEADVTLRPSPRNTLHIFGAYTNAKYKYYLPQGEGGVDFAGRPLDRTPLSSVTASYTYTLPLGQAGTLTFNGRVKLSDSYVLSSFSTGIQFRQPAYTRTDVSMTYTAPDDRWYIQAYGNNLENEVLATASTYVSGALAIVPGDPLTYGVRAGFKF